MGIFFVQLSCMKQLLILLAFCSTLLSACGNAQVNGENSDEGSTEEKAKKNVSRRDYSITPDVAYSDLFLDSAALENFISTKSTPDSISRRMRSFYNTRNYQFAWFTSSGLTEQARGFWNLHDYHTSANSHDTVLHDKELEKRMDDLLAAESISVKSSDAKSINTELALTQHFIQYMMAEFDGGYVKRKEMERFIPRKKEDAVYLADSLYNKKHKDNKYFEDVHRPYGLLKEQLGRYIEIVKAGGWQPIPAGTKTLRKGTSNPAIAVVKKRLQITGDLPVADSSYAFSDTLETAVKQFQARHGLTDDGIINAATIKEMNVPAEARLQQLLMNLGRMRWLPPDPSGKLILVNIPEFMLHVYEGKNRVFDMVVVVGKQGTNTTMFTGDLNQIVFSPYWNLPTSIVKNEVLPAMQRNPNYLDGQNMEIVSDKGDLPTIRQKPGPGNALGKVKFLFPNSFDIYFHDTPSKSLFERTKRAFSHGCIRLAEPEKMANYLLRDQPEWTPDRINDAMNAGEEKYVKLKDPVPVVITYYTAWVDDAGKLNFREDIYGHDKRLAAKMFPSSLQQNGASTKDSMAVAQR